MSLNLVRRIFVSMLRVAVAAAVIALVAACVRLLPWVAAPSVPWSVVCTFGLALALGALEVALVVAPALGAALYASRALGDGSARALFCLGVGPTRQAAHAACAAAAFGFASLAVSWGWGLQAHNPGRLSNQLVASTDSTCVQAQVHQLPGLSMSSVCENGRARLVGWSPKHDGPAILAWSSSTMRFADDLSSVRLHDVELAVRKPAIHVRVAEVTVRGLLPWIASNPLPGWVRGVGCALAGWLSALTASWVVLRVGSGSRALAFVLGAVGPGCFVGLGPWLAARYPDAVGLLAALAASVVSTVLLGAMIDRVRLLTQWWSGTRRVHSGSGIHG